MQTSSLSFRASDGAELLLRRFLPDEGLSVRAVIHGIHGMAEHSARYAEVAESLTAAGYAVYVGDHRGHGGSVATREDLGAFAGPFARLSQDICEMLVFEKGEAGHVPVFLLGHSMGTLIAEQVMVATSTPLAGVVLSAPIGMPDVLNAAGRLLAHVEAARQGARGRSSLLFGMTFGAYNKAFAPVRTTADWLSRDTAEVDKYVADPLCGFAVTNGFWVSFLGALGDPGRSVALRRVDRTLPVLVLSGTEDPVNRRTRGAKAVAGALRRAGLTEVTHRFYAGARHEILHELNRDEVTRDIAAWLEVARGREGAAQRGEHEGLAGTKA